MITEECGKGSECLNERVAGGKKSCAGQFPWMVNIIFNISLILIKKTQMFVK